MKAPSSARAATTPAAGGPPLLRENIGTIAVLTLDRPQSRNSLSEAMLAALRQELERLAADKRIRAVVLAANGPAFSAGHDLKELTAHRADPDQGRGYTRHIMESCSAMMLPSGASPFVRLNLASFDGGPHIGMKIQRWFRASSMVAGAPQMPFAA